jgi:hypothetical protein
MREVEVEVADDGRPSAAVFREGDRILLRQCAETLTQDLAAEPCERFDGMDQIFWDFSIAGNPVTLHWKKAEGIFVRAGRPSAQSEELIRRIADHLQRRLAR